MRATIFCSSIAIYVGFALGTIFYGPQGCPSAGQHPGRSVGFGSPLAFIIPMILLPILSYVAVRRYQSKHQGLPIRIRPIIAYPLISPLWAAATLIGLLRLPDEYGRSIITTKLFGLDFFSFGFVNFCIFLGIAIGLILEIYPRLKTRR